MGEQLSHVYKWFIELDDGAIEQWLRAQALAGWHLQRFRFPCRFTFVRGEPSDLVYRFDSYPAWRRSADYEQLCRDAGWELAFYCWGSYCWRKPAADGKPNEMYTDKASKIAKQKRLLAYMGLCGLPIMINLLNIEHPMSDTKLVLNCVQLVLGAMLLCVLWRVCRRLRQLRRETL